MMPSHLRTLKLSITYLSFFNTLVFWDIMFKTHDKILKIIYLSITNFPFAYAMHVIGIVIFYSRIELH